MDFQPHGSYLSRIKWDSGMDFQPHVPYLSRIKWDSGMDYQPHVPFFRHYSAWMLILYKGNYVQFIDEVSK